MGCDLEDLAVDGWSADKVFGGTSAGYSYDDLVFMPGNLHAGEVDLTSRLTNRIRLKMPFVSSPVDSVTESDMAILMACLGGVGFVHGNQSISSQVDMITRVKGFVNGFILEPFVMGPKTPISELDRLKAERGVGSVPITEDGQLRGKLIGWAGARDTDTIDDRSRPLQSVMVRKVVMGTEPISLQEATDLLRKAKVGKLPIVDTEGRLVSMVARSDVKKARDHPDMNRTDSSQLFVGAAIQAGMPDALERAKALIAVGTDVLFLDGSGADSDSQLTLLMELKRDHPGTDVVAGPAVSCREAKRLAEAGADAILVGSASPAGGDIFGDLVAVGRPEATAMYEVATYVRLNFKIPALAGPGICNVGQALKALCLGASCVLASDLLAGTEETPGPKHLRGMAWHKLQHSEQPVRAVHSRLSCPGQTDVVDRHAITSCNATGPVEPVLRYALKGFEAGMQDLGYSSIDSLHMALDDGDLRLEARAPFGAQVSKLASESARMQTRPHIAPHFAAPAGSRM